MITTFRLAAVAAIFIYGCAQSTSTDTAKSTEAKTDSLSLPVVADDTYPCQMANPDTSVYGILLRDTASAIKQLGRIGALTETDGLPQTNFLSEDKKQKLTLYFHNGDFTNQFSEFSVGAASAEDNYPQLKTKSFASNSGIELGYSKAQVTAILGECFKKNELSRTTEVLKYGIDDFANSAFLPRYNMPIYYGEYTFENDVLASFKFGFEMP